MLQPLLTKCPEIRIVLASASPRRKDILLNSIPEMKFEIVPSNAEENLDKADYNGRPWQYAVDTARLKATEVFERLKGSNQDLLVIGADTIVAFEGVIYGKPKDREQAVETLQTLNNRMHQVYTGVVLLSTRSGKSQEFHEKTDVFFDELSPEVIEAYVDTLEPMDKAGAYGIQARGGTLVKKIDGCYYNVAGFPLHHFAKKMVELLNLQK